MHDPRTTLKVEEWFVWFASSVWIMGIGLVLGVINVWAWIALALFTIITDLTERVPDRESGMDRRLTADGWRGIPTGTFFLGLGLVVILRAHVPGVAEFADSLRSTGFILAWTALPMAVGGGLWMGALVRKRQSSKG